MYLQGCGIMSKNDFTILLWFMGLSVIAVVCTNLLGNAGSIAAIIAGSISLITAIILLGKLWWNRQYAQIIMHFLLNGGECKFLRLRKGNSETKIQVRLDLNQPTIPMSIRLTPSLSTWKRILRLLGLWKGVKEPNAKDNCGLEIRKVFNITWHHYVNRPMPEPTPGQHAKVYWNLEWGVNEPPIPAPGPIVLELVLLPYGVWRGDIEFSGIVKGRRLFIRRKVEVGE